MLSNKIVYFVYELTRMIVKLISYKLVDKQILSGPAFVVLLNSSENKLENWV